jgi:DNA-binding NtrC family response regulator
MQTIEEALNSDASENEDAGVPGRVTCAIGAIVAESASMREVCMMIERVAPTDVTVLFRGERGVGKQLAGRAIHELSMRSEAPFVVADCKDKTEDELVLHLFGRAGDESNPGAFLEAQAGTLWLSEIGHLSMDFQEVLSGVFKSKTIYPVGSDQAIPINVRILAETAEDIQLALAERRFRPDLFARFAPIAVEIKPLRERREDILPLAYRVIQLEDPSIRLKREAQAALLHYAWPGNITELEAAIKDALQKRSGTVIESEDLPDAIVKSASDAPSSEVATPGHARALKAFLRSKDVDPETALTSDKAS